MFDFKFAVYNKPSDTSIVQTWQLLNIIFPPTFI